MTHDCKTCTCSHCRCQGEEGRSHQAVALDEVERCAEWIEGDDVGMP